MLGATTAVFGGSRLEEPLSAWLERLGLGRAAGPIAFVLVIGLVSYLSLVLGELVPKSLALRAPERFSLLIAKPLGRLSWLFRPVVWLLTTSSNVVLRPFRDRTNFSESRLSPDELQQLVEEAAEAGALDASSGEIASRAIDLGRLEVGALMVPRRRIVALDVESTRAHVLSVLESAPHARYPVFEGSLEHPIGYVLTRELYGPIVRDKLDLRRLVRPVTYFPETAPATKVLRELQSSKQQLALVLDEQGGLAGLVSVEDVAEELFGEILEEHEVERELARLADDGTLVAAGDAPVHEIERLMGEELAHGSTATTMAGLLAHLEGRVPRVGDRVAVSPRVEAEVLEATPRRVGKLRLRTLAPEPAADE